MNNSFDKIIGYKNIKTELQRLVDIMVNREKYDKLGVTTPRGLMLYGDPGVGKTLMANCFVEATGCPVFVCRKTKADGAFVDEIKNTFNQAAENAPSIVLLDDLDKFANEDDRHREAEEYVAVQACIDEVKDKEVFVLATANGIRKLPDSLLRAGRFDRVINVGRPQGKDAQDIIRYYIAQKKNVKNIDAEEVAKILSGCSCATLETVINEAAVYAGSDGKDCIEMDDIVRACLRVVFHAPEDLSEEQNKYILNIAYHEAGHAVIHEVLEPGSVDIVSVKKYDSDTGGITSFTPAEGYWLDYGLMEHRIVALLGGRAATELVFGTIDVGADEDLDRATSVVDRFASSYGAYGFEKRIDSGMRAPESLSAQRDRQCAMELERYYRQAKQILVQNRQFLDKLAHALVEKKTLLSKDIAAIRDECQAAA